MSDDNSNQRTQKPSLLLQRRYLRCFLQYRCRWYVQQVFKCESFDVQLDTIKKIRFPVLQSVLCEESPHPRLRFLKMGCRPSLPQVVDDRAAHVRIHSIYRVHPWALEGIGGVFCSSSWGNKAPYQCPRVSKIRIKFVHHGKEVVFNLQRNVPGKRDGIIKLDTRTHASA